LSQSATQIQELWTGYIGSNVDNLQIGQIRWGGLFFSITIGNGQQNWLFSNLPTPNIRDGWKIKSLKLRIRTEGSPFGGIDKVGIKDGENVVHEFNPLAITSFNHWQIMTLDVPGPRNFSSALGVSIHLSNRVDTKVDPPSPLPPVRILVSSIGVEFIKQSMTGPVIGGTGIGTVIHKRSISSSEP
jgi:hypothetical protein